MSNTLACPNCQAENPAGAKFCASCGNKFSPYQSAPDPAPSSAKKSNTWIWVVGMIGLCLVCLALIIILWFTGDKILMVFSNILATSTPTATMTLTPTNTATMTSTPTITLTPTMGLSDSRIRAIDGMVEIFIPGGEFTMGSNEGDDDEVPVHTVFLGDYWIDQTEVTNGQYGLCVDAGVCNLPQQTDSVTRSSYFYNPTYRDYPVIYVTWQDAYDYCDWVGGYLPSEAEWEKAARGENGYKYPWGNADPTTSLANFGDNLGDTAKVGSYPLGASPYGVLDMAGNVYEWVYDYYSAGYYSESPYDYPLGPTSGDKYVLRSASFNTSASVIRSANRGSYAPDTTGDDDGFRCIRYSGD